MTETIDITPIIANETYSPHVQTLKQFVEGLSRIMADDKNQLEVVPLIRTALPAVRDAMSEVLADDFILLLTDKRRPGHSRGEMDADISLGRRR